MLNFKSSFICFKNSFPIFFTLFTQISNHLTKSFISIYLFKIGSDKNVLESCFFKECFGTNFQQYYFFVLFHTWYYFCSFGVKWNFSCFLVCLYTAWLMQFSTFIEKSLSCFLIFSFLLVQIFSGTINWLVSLPYINLNENLYNIIF